MKILVTGPDGFVGRAVCNLLAERGNFVRGALWAEAPLPEYCESTVVGDIGPYTKWSSVLSGIDAVVHLAARVHVMKDRAADPLSEFRKVNLEGTRRLAKKAVVAGVQRFVFLSSVKVNGEETDDQTGPFKESSRDHPMDPYAISKWEAEKVLKEIESVSGMEVVVIRPPLIYGPGVKANFSKLIELVDRGLPLPFGLIKNRRSLLSLKNVSDLIFHCVIHPFASGQTFLASDGEDVSTPELVRRIAKALGKPARLIPMPENLLKFAGFITRKNDQISRLCGSLQIDSSKVRQLLGWKPPCSMQEELNRMAGWWKMRESN